MTAPFGERLKTWRTARGITQDDVARATGVRQQTVRGWEVGENRPQAKRLGALAEVLGVPPQELMEAYIETADDEPTERQPPPAVPVIEHMLSEVLSWQQRLSQQIDAVLAELSARQPEAPLSARGSPTSRQQRPGPR